MVALAFAVTFSHHGLHDLMTFQKQLTESRKRIRLIEEENRRLSRSVELLQTASQEVRERHWREALGFAKPGEMVYLESSTPRR